MLDTKSTIAEITRRRARLPVFAGSVVAGSALLVLIKPLAAAIATVGLFVAVPIDIRRTRTPLHYSDSFLESEEVRKLNEALDEIAQCDAVWYVRPSEEEAIEPGEDRNYTRKRVTPRRAAPPFLRTNVRGLRLPAGLSILYFMPDRLFVHRSDGISAVEYDDLRVTYGSAIHMEEEGVPAGARVLRTRWKHETKMGRPDRRFAKNFQVPVVRYGRVRFVSSSELDVTIQLSKPELMLDLGAAISALSRRIPDYKLTS